LTQSKKTDVVLQDKNEIPQLSPDFTRGLTAQRVADLCEIAKLFRSVGKDGMESGVEGFRFSHSVKNGI
jgi:hypothetical protein